VDQQHHRDARRQAKQRRDDQVAARQAGDVDDGQPRLLGAREGVLMPGHRAAVPPSRGAPDSTTAAAGMISAPQAGTPGGHAHAASAHTVAAKAALIAVTIAGNTHHGSRMRQAASAHPRTPKTAPPQAASAGEYGLPPISLPVYGSYRRPCPLTLGPSSRRHGICA
jgi:hypothetical protein